MSLVTSIHATGSGDQSLLDKLAAKMAPDAREDLHEVMGLAVRDQVKQHLTDYDAENPNALGGTRTHWFRDAAMSTASYASSAEAVVTVSWLGIRLSFYGGTVTPGKGTSSITGKPTRFLTIPACAAAHGRRASEFGNLTFAMTGDGPALVEGSTAVKLSGPKGKKQFKEVIKKGKSMKPATVDATSGLKVMFWLARSVTIGPHPELLPQDEQIRQVAVAAGWEWIMDTQGPEAST